MDELEFLLSTTQYTKLVTRKQPISLTGSNQGTYTLTPEAHLTYTTKHNTRQSTVIANNQPLQDRLTTIIYHIQTNEQLFLQHWLMGNLDYFNIKPTINIQEKQIKITTNPEPTEHQSIDFSFLFSILPIILIFGMVLIAFFYIIPMMQQNINQSSYNSSTIDIVSFVVNNQFLFLLPIFLISIILLYTIIQRRYDW